MPLTILSDDEEDQRLPTFGPYPTHATPPPPPVAKPVTAPRHCSNCGKPGTLASHCDCQKAAKQHADTQAGLFKAGKILFVNQISGTTGNEHLSFELPVTHVEFLGYQKRLEQNLRDRVQFHVATVASHLNKKRRAAELELEKEDKELEEQRHKEDLARHERRAKAQRRAVFGDDVEAETADNTPQHTQPPSSFSIGGAVFGLGRAVAGTFAGAAAAAVTRQATAGMGCE